MKPSHFIFTVFLNIIISVSVFILLGPRVDYSGVGSMDTMFSVARSKFENNLTEFEVQNISKLPVSLKRLKFDSSACNCNCSKERMPTRQRGGHFLRKSQDFSQSTSETHLEEMQDVGFVFTRHVNSYLSDFIWKECYTSIRRVHDYPILIIDDNSNKKYLTENLNLVNTRVVYDSNHTGAGELLAYFYYHKLHPFKTAVILHDSVFLQQPLKFSPKPVHFMWVFGAFAGQTPPVTQSILRMLSHSDELVAVYHSGHWTGNFGCMSVIQWDALNNMSSRYKMWDEMLPKCRNRDDRCAFERVLGVLVSHYFKQTSEPGLLGNIFGYTAHGFKPFHTSFADYVSHPDFKLLPAVKVWLGR